MTTKNAPKAGDFKLSTNIILASYQSTTGSNEPLSIDIRETVQEIQIYEGINYDTLSGTMVIVDAGGLLDRLPITGNEILEFTLHTPGFTLEEDTPRGYNFIKYDRLINDKDYVLKCMTNLENAKRRGEKIYGTTELRTSLQTESRNYTRQIKTPWDETMGLEPDITRKSRTSDMFYWFTLLGPRFVEFYKKKPTMEESFNFLTSFRGIGNYYGYHFSTNLARMPEIGTAALLQEGSLTGNLNENDDFVAPGVGAMETINWFYEHLGFSVSSHVGAKVIRQIRDTQHDFFDFTGINEQILNRVTETGSFTTFGCEISTCQFSVFRRLRESKSMALNRSSAPISQETIGGACAVPSQTYSQGTLF